MFSDFKCEFRLNWLVNLRQIISDCLWSFYTFENNTKISKTAKYWKYLVLEIPRLQPCTPSAFWDAFNWPWKCDPSLTWMGHHLCGVCFGLLQSRNPALTLALWIRLQVVAPPPTRQHKVTGVAHLYVHRRQGNRASAGVCHFCLSPKDRFTYTQSHIDVSLRGS